MISLKRIALTAAALASAALLVPGCRSKDTAAKAPPAKAEQKAAPGAVPAWLGLGKAPLDEVGRLLMDLDSGDPCKFWRAEDILQNMGDSVAPRTRRALAASTPEARAAACRLAYNFRDQEAIGGMIALLGDESRMVRNTANVFLCGLTGRDFNFRPDALPEDRAAAQSRWQKWYAAAGGPAVAPRRD
ncbi:MAG TPA: hypothetical protein PK280_20625 [Planctomycetota bacterium]|nr:hypothetical protein [Planctomycetota bacterium]